MALIALSRSQCDTLNTDNSNQGGELSIVESLDFPAARRYLPRTTPRLSAAFHTIVRRECLQIQVEESSVALQEPFTRGSSGRGREFDADDVAAQRDLDLARKRQRVIRF